MLYTKDELLEKVIHKYGFESEETLAIANLLYNSKHSLEGLNFIIIHLL